MKKFRTILTAAALCMIFVMAAGCSISQATNIELISYPKTEFFKGEDIKNMPFTILVTLNNENTTQLEFSLASPGAVQVANFSTKNVGSFTAYFTYRSFTYRFDYTVVGEGEYTGFAGGEGTQADPFQIANAEHFKNIVLKGDDSKYTWYELTADIDLSGLDVAADSEYRNKIEIGQFKYPAVPEYEFNGSLDGNGHKLMNFRATTDLGIFGTIKNGDFSNIIIDGFNTVGYRVGAFGNGPYSTNGTAKATFTNITVNDNCRMGFAGFIYQAKGAESVAFTNCQMNGAVYGDGDNVGGFMGDVQSPTTFENCTMGGTVVGFNHVGAFVGWLGNGAEGAVVTGKDKGNTLTGTAKCFGDNTSDYGEVSKNVYEAGHFNAAELVQGTISNLSKTTDSISWDDVEGAAYYRVVFGGTLLHFIREDAESTEYVLHFVGGYITPMKVSESIEAVEGKTSYSYGTVYSSLATSFPEGFVVEGRTIMVDGKKISFDRNGKDANIPFVNYDKDTNVETPVDLQDWFKGGLDGIITGQNGWLVVPAVWTENSLILAKETKITIRVFAYNADGIIIAGGQVA